MLGNGELIRKASAEGFEVMVTTDQNIRHQQNLTDVGVGIVVLMATSWPRAQRRIDEIRKAIEEVKPGEVTEVPI